MGTTWKVWLAMRAWRLGERLVKNAQPSEREEAIAELRSAVKRLSKGRG